MEKWKDWNGYEAGSEVGIFDIVNGEVYRPLSCKIIPMKYIGIVLLFAFSNSSHATGEPVVGPRVAIQKNGSAQVTRSFTQLSVTEVFEVSWMKGQKQTMPRDAVAERFYANAIFANGYWLRDGDYRLKRQDGSNWITGKFKDGNCAGKWTELDSKGKVVRTITCKNGFSGSSDGSAPKSDAEFYLKVTDFHFEVGEFTLELDVTGAVRLRAPLRLVRPNQGGPSLALAPPKEFLLRADEAFTKKVRELARSSELTHFQDKYENRGITDGTTRTFQWKDGAFAKSISCYVDCPPELKSLYRKTVDAFFQDGSFALELSALGIFLSPDR